MEDIVLRGCSASADIISLKQFQKAWVYIVHEPNEVIRVPYFNPHVKNTKTQENRAKARKTKGKLKR